MGKNGRSLERCVALFHPFIIDGLGKVVQKARKPNRKPSVLNRAPRTHSHCVNVCCFVGTLVKPKTSVLLLLFFIPKSAKISLSHLFAVQMTSSEPCMCVCCGKAIENKKTPHLFRCPLSRVFVRGYVTVGKISIATPRGYT